MTGRFHAVQAEEIAKTIDHTLLRTEATSADVEALCREAGSLHFAAVCVLPHYVPMAAALLKGTDVKVCTVVSFPHGADTARIKALAADDAVRRGADEIDVVINVSALLSGEVGLVRDELAGVVRAVRVRLGSMTTTTPSPQPSARSTSGSTPGAVSPDGSRPAGPTPSAPSATWLRAWSSRSRSPPRV